MKTDCGGPLRVVGRSSSHRRGPSMDGRGKYYAVRKGKNPGIYRSWEEADEQVMGVPGAQHKSFPALEEAMEYMARNSRARRGTGPAPLLGGGATVESIASQLSRFRVTTTCGGDPGA
ncbi:hypothetical protein PIB30_011851 [Stylosanthes scabra]|uniref:Ribonuclease H1 N-terminal domain-containing protein n=1 Tax=Stylosanthes scabra TaxID=79078 RepID=A0ABU6T6A9_9FABA|nr:hypothetical protein [Stylosanthes scabra]